MLSVIGLAMLVGSTCSSALPPCVCTKQLAPVCGSDGQTYSNQCLLRCAQLSDPLLKMKSIGSCDMDLSSLLCVCTLEDNPVCGTDNKTYSNRCSLKCTQRYESVEIAYEGQCREKRETVQVAEQPDSDCFCTLDYRPVCGSDGNTYGNPCSLNCKSNIDKDLKLSHMGECEDRVQVVNSASCICTRIAKPVCGTDGNTYGNPCMLNCARQNDDNLNIEHEGPCGSVKVVDTAESADCVCTRNLKPVCASNGVTFNNECMMRCAGAGLTVAKNGPCEE